jgi:hypothetical protein
MKYFSLYRGTGGNGHWTPVSNEIFPGFNRHHSKAKRSSKMDNKSAWLKKEFSNQIKAFFPSRHGYD